MRGVRGGAYRGQQREGRRGRRGGSRLVAPPPGGGGFLNEPLIDEPLGGTVAEAFRDGFESGLIDTADGGEWNVVEGAGEEKPIAQTAVKRSGTYGVQLQCGPFDGTNDHWDTTGTGTAQTAPKIGITRGSFDTPANWIKTQNVFMSSWHFIPTAYPALQAGSAMGNYLIFTQFKGNGVNFEPILNIVLGRDTGDPAGTFRISTHVRPGQGAPFLRQFAAGAQAICPVNQWFNITQKVVPHQTTGEWHGWRDGVKVFGFTNMDTVRDKDQSDDIVTAATADGYIFYPFNNIPVDSTVENFSLYGDDAQFWGLT